MEKRIKELELQVERLSKYEYTKTTLDKEMEQYGLFSKGWNFKFNNSKRCSGVAKFRSKMIEISINYIESDTTTKEDLLNTILHEIAHAIVGCDQGHNEVWKKKAIEIGCNGKTKCRIFSKNNLFQTY